ncbi:MAG TPA: hypothetical protein VK939_03745 [Longimicrobiales bacterium]|nr:hypothetical protein [Longimicrobiales bacterium]
MAQEADATASPPDWAGDLGFAAGNAAVGGLAAGIVRSLRGDAFWPAFRDGALGGALSYGGRRVAAAGFDGAGFLGREIGAVGTSIVRNALHGVPVLERVVLPLGPLRLHVGPRPGSASARTTWIALDLPTILASTYFALRSDTEFRLGASLSAGAPVFESHVRWADGYWAGTQAAGVIWLRGNPDDPSPDAERSAAFAHERVHVLQYDFAMLLSEPVEAWLATRARGGAWLDRHVDFGFQLIPWEVANRTLPYHLRPWEQEAWFLSGVRAAR